MKLDFSFSVLLASLLCASSVEAIPMRRNPSTGMVTMPVKRLHQSQTDVHPHLFIQQHKNRGHRRLARMTGRPGPSDAELRRNMEKRMYLLDSEFALRSRDNEGSRFTPRYRMGKAAQGMVAGSQTLATTNGTMGNSSMPATGSMPANGSMPGNSSMPANGSKPGNGTVTGNMSGVSPIDIKAAQNGGLTHAKPPTANNSLGLNIEANDIGYVATIQIGTPPTNFSILMDSGSADFWVGSTVCQDENGGSCGNHTFLGTTTSSSFQQSQQQFEVQYGSGAVAGDLCQDNVDIAGLALKAHQFGVATLETIQFSSDTVPFDGLMGLASSNLSEEAVPTPVEALAAAGLIAAPITSFKISRVSDQLNDGEITFGGLDPTKFNSSTLVTFPNVNAQGFWEGSMPAITINGADSGLKNRTAILDTGTTLILAPPQDAAAVNQMLGGSCDSQGSCTVPCTVNASLALTFGNASFPIDPRDITVLPVDLNNPTGDCVSGIQGGTIGGPTEWLVGDVFLKNAYFSTNLATNKISLAKF